MIRDLPTVGYEQNQPDPGGTAGVFRRIGYSLTDALADLIDNSIDAGAHQVLIRFFRSEDRIHRIVIADDGHGMSEAEIKKAMQYGVRVNHSGSDLGKYGVGLKSASFSQCQSVSVVTKKNSEVSGRRWTLESIENDWRQEVIDPAHATTLVNSDWQPLFLDDAGTLVIWDDLDGFGDTDVNGDPDRKMATVLKSLLSALGLKFHRFIDSGRLSITVDTIDVKTGGRGFPVSVAALDPFGYAVTGKLGFPSAYRVIVGKVELTLLAHIWPPKSKEPNYRLGGGNVAARQGFYFYRNDRLIQAGGWNGLQNDTEPHYSLARVCVDLPAALDSSFRLSVQKSRIDPPTGFVSSVISAVSASTTFREYLAIANEVYRTAKVERMSTDGVSGVGRGVPAAVSREMNRRLGASASRSFSFVWATLPPDHFFEIRRESDSIVLNKNFRRSVLGDERATATDAPLVKTLLFLLLKDELQKQRSSKNSEAWVRDCNAMLIRAVHAHG